MADNKMWEGHRIIYPHLRDKYLAGRKVPLARPVLDQQKLELLQYSLAEAKEKGGRITLTIWSPEGLQERKITLPPGKECIFRQDNRAILKILDEFGRPGQIPLDYILDIR